MKPIEKIINRLRGMGFNIQNNAPYCHHMRAGDWKWSVSCSSFDIGSSSTMKECLAWERWHYSSSLHEIFEWHQHDSIDPNDIIE